MAVLHDWVELTETTLRSLRRRNVSHLYELEWPAARRRLIEEHLPAIEQDRRRIRRWARTFNALLYGLAKRLTPERRVLFLVALPVGLISIGYLLFHYGSTANAAKVIVSLALAFAVITFLLALELIDKLRFRDELELARDLQVSLLPREMPSVPGWEVAAVTQSANTVGGDLYDFVVLPDGRLAVLFGDASGHGMAAGLVMAVAQAAFRTQLDIDPSPRSILGSLNRILCRTGGPQSFFAACYVLLQPDGTYSASLAGHPPLLHASADGRLLDRVGHGSYPLGIKPSLCWPVMEGALQPGEVLLFYSDGLPEAWTLSEEAFGYERFEAIASRDVSGPAGAVCERVLSEWRRFIGDQPIEDDISVAVIKRVAA
jgi:serine phosphatase RsbU (regulator of sigma subunit)